MHLYLLESRYIFYKHHTNDVSIPLTAPFICACHLTQDLVLYLQELYQLFHEVSRVQSQWGTHSLTKVQNTGHTFLGQDPLAKQDGGEWDMWTRGADWESILLNHRGLCQRDTWGSPIQPGNSLRTHSIVIYVKFPRSGPGGQNTVSEAKTESPENFN